MDGRKYIPSIVRQHEQRSEVRKGNGIFEDQKITLLLDQRYV